MGGRRTGLNEKTVGRIVFDSAMVVLNIDDEATRIKLGACRDGSTFALETEYRDIPIDGVPGAVKGLRRVVSTTASVTVNLLEVSKEILTRAVPGSSFPETSTPGVDENGVEVTDEVFYEITRVMSGVIPTFQYDDIALVCTYGRNKTPIIFGLKSAMVNSSLSLELNDSNEAVIAMTFTGMLDPENLDVEPWFIRVPEMVGGSSPSPKIKTAEDLTKLAEELEDAA